MIITFGTLVEKERLLVVNYFHFLSIEHKQDKNKMKHKVGRNSKSTVISEGVVLSLFQSELVLCNVMLKKAIQELSHFFWN